MWRTFPWDLNARGGHAPVAPNRARANRQKITTSSAKVAFMIPWGEYHTLRKSPCLLVVELLSCMSKAIGTPVVQP